MTVFLLLVLLVMTASLTFDIAFYCKLLTASLSLLGLLYIPNQ